MHLLGGFMGKHLVLVADSSNARVLIKNGTSLDQVGPTYARKEEDEFDKGAAKPGRNKQNASSGGHAYSPHTDIHRVEKGHFIRELAHHLNNGLSDMDSLVLVAPPQTLGELRKLLSHNVLTKVEHEVAKDLTKMKKEDIASYVFKPFQ